jgi:hypothetical protein
LKLGELRICDQMPREGELCISVPSLDARGWRRRASGAWHELLFLSFGWHQRSGNVHVLRGLS